MKRALSHAAKIPSLRSLARSGRYVFSQTYIYVLSRRHVSLAPLPLNFVLAIPQSDSNARERKLWPSPSPLLLSAGPVCSHPSTAHIKQQQQKTRGGSPSPPNQKEPAPCITPVNTDRTAALMTACLRRQRALLRVKSLHLKLFFVLMIYGCCRRSRRPSIARLTPV